MSCNKDKKDQSNNEYERWQPGTQLMKCAACRTFMPLLEFSNNQRRNGSQARCKKCVDSGKPTVSESWSGNQEGKPTDRRASLSGPPEKKQKVSGVSNVPPKMPPSMPPKYVCSSCQKEQNRKSFPCDLVSDNGSLPECIKCIIKRLGRVCKVCSIEKSKDGYSYSDWNRLPDQLVTGDHSQKPAAEIESLAREAFKNEFTCTECKEKREREACRAVLKKHNVHFYNFTKVFDMNQNGQSEKDAKSNLHLTYSKTVPTDLVGTYDIIFHRGFHQDMDIENRTTRGTAVLEENGPNKTLSGRVEFHPDLRVSGVMCFQYDFTLSNGSHDYFKIDEPYGYWRCQFDVQLVDEEARDLIQDEDESCRAYIISNTKPSAIPLMKIESFGGEDEEDECTSENMVMFETLEEAKRLMKVHKERQTGKTSWLVRHMGLPKSAAQLVHQYICHIPQPAFFLEPGDLILSVNWDGEFGGSSCFTDIVLRKKTVVTQEVK